MRLFRMELDFYLVFVKVPFVLHIIRRGILRTNVSVGPVF